MTTKKFRLGKTIAVATASILVLAGCSGSGTDSLSYWAAFPSVNTQKYFQTNFIDSFNTDSIPPVKMDVKQLQNLGSLTDTAVSAGRGPDVVYSAGPANALGFASGDRIESLTTYAEQYGWADKLLPWAYEASEVDGQLYSVPVSYGSLVLYYNPETFKKHGWTVPKTAAEFEDVATKAKDAGLMPIGAGNSGYKAQSEWYLSAVLNASVGPKKLYQALSGTAKFTDPEFESAISTFKDQIDAGWWGGGADRYFTNTDTDMFTGLANGSIAMYITGTWSFGSIDSFFGKAAGNNATWDWAPLPAMSDTAQPGVFPLAIGNSLSINAGSKNTEAAAKFIDSMINDPKKSYAYTAATGENPPPLSASEDLKSSGVDDRVSKLYSAIPDSKNLGYATWAFLPPATDTYLYTEFDKVITGSLSPAAYLQGLQTSFDSEKQSGKTPSPFTPIG